MGRPKMKATEMIEGPEATARFERGMTKVFQVTRAELEKAEAKRKAGRLVRKRTPKS